MIHIVKCFIQAFFIIAGVAAVVIAIFQSSIWAVRVIVMKTGWRSENVGVGVAASWVMLLIWVLLSLTLCGVIK